LLPLVVFSTLLLSGCITLGPDFETPESQVADEWLEAEDERVKADPAQTLEWWKTFEDPILESLIQQAYERNPTLQIAGLRVYESRATLGIAVGTLYPQVQNIGFAAGRVELSENAEPISNLPDPPRAGVDTTLGDYRLGFDAAWEVDFWGRFRRTVESADAHMAATIASYDDVLVTLTGEVAAAYILLRTFEERLAVAESNVAIQKRSLEISEVRSRNQLTTELDPALARALFRNTQSQIPALRSAIRKVKNALSILLNQPPGVLDAELGTGGKIPTSPVEIALGVPADLLRRRPDVRRAELHAAAQSARIGVAKADLFPALSLVGSIGWSSENTGDLLDQASRFGFGLVGVRWKILNYGRIINLMRAEDARFQQLIVNYQNTVLRAAREVEDATSSFIAAHEQVELLADGAKAAERAVELSMIQYRDGVADYTRVLDSQRFLLLQQDALTRARGRVAESLVAVYKALGGGWEQRDLDALVSEQARDAMSERTYWGDLLEPGSVEPVPEKKRGWWRLPDF
jgi:NodT family efflux transporter outer membrane factor (OMF) lipoprotein